MNELFKQRMTVDDVIPWAMAQPRGRYELLNGEVLIMSPEKARHWRTKAVVFIALAEAVKRAGLPCEVVPDGATVRINERTAYEPDALVYCGPRVSVDAVEVENPIIVVQVASPRTSRIDTGAQFVGYFSLPSLKHYLIIDAEKGVIIHHERGHDDQVVSSSLTQGTLRLDPPGIDVAAADLLPPPETADA